MGVRFLLALLALLTLTTPARADDIGAAGRGVVRVVTLAVVDGEVAGFGHGSGFAVAPNRIVTNAHVVEAAARYPDNVLVGIVPSAGDKSYQARLIAVDPARDLALLEFTGLRLPPLTLYAGPVSEGDVLVALGYPGNVDIATARSMSDFIRPLSPVRSQGVFSGARMIGETQVLLHTANIARGNSGGPLLDRCGRVIGVNSAITRADDGDASFGFAIADVALISFLREAKQPVASIGIGCVSREERLANEKEEAANARSSAEAKARAAEAKSRAELDAAIARGRADNLVARENYMGIAGLLLVIGALVIGWGLFLAGRNDPRARWVIVAGAGVICAAVAVFLSRPNFDPDKVSVATSGTAPATPGAPGKMLCAIDPKRSHITVSAASQISFAYGGDGCVNGRTQYAEDGHGGWQRVFVPNQDWTVSVVDWDPATATYTDTRYMLGDKEMREARALRKGVGTKACSKDDAARASLAGEQAAIRAALPREWHEKLVYSCKPGAG